MTQRERITAPDIASRKALIQSGKQDPICAVTAYDFSTAHFLDLAGPDIILVGDSLANVVQGKETTLPVTLDEMVYHTRCVRPAVKRALLVADLPFLSYEASVEQALLSAGRLLKEGGAEAVKLEGGKRIASQVKALVDAGIPVMGHIGLTPQSVRKMGGFKIQGKKEESPGVQSEEKIFEDAQILQEAGVFALVIEGVPEELGRRVSDTPAIPTIGIGAGRFCDGQILVANDMLGLSVGRTAKFVRAFADLGMKIEEATKSYCEAVRKRSFPGAEQVYSPVGDRKSQEMQ